MGHPTPQTPLKHPAQNPIYLVSESISVGNFIRMGTFPVYLVSKGRVHTYFCSLFVPKVLVGFSLAGSGLFLRHKDPLGVVEI